VFLEIIILFVSFEDSQIFRSSMIVDSVSNIYNNNNSLTYNISIFARSFFFYPGDILLYFISLFIDSSDQIIFLYENTYTKFGGLISGFFSAVYWLVIFFSLLFYYDFFLGNKS
jgi:hypothetical protein